MLHDNFKIQINERELEAIGRTILVFCLHHFKGDEKVKMFISSTITKSVTRSRIIGQDITFKEAVKDEPYTPDSNDPSKQKKPLKVPKRGTQNSKPVLVEAGPDWKTVDPDTLVIDPGYRKHLAQHSKKILSRVKLLWCLRHEIIGSFADKILLGLPASLIYHCKYRMSMGKHLQHGGMWRQTSHCSLEFSSMVIANLYFLHNLLWLSPITLKYTNIESSLMNKRQLIMNDQLQIESHMKRGIVRMIVYLF